MTPVQQRVLDAVRNLVVESACRPSLRELADYLDMGLSQTHSIVDALVRSGHLTRDPGRPRSLGVPDAPDLRSVSTSAIRAELARRGLTFEALAPKATIARGTARSCAADTCGHAVDPGQLFCRDHWFKLPRDIQDGIRQAYARRDTGRYQDLVAEARDLCDGGQRWSRAS
jgi:hypothetical protein